MKKILICISLLLCNVSYAFADEQGDRKQIADSVAKMFHAEQFEELSKLSDQYLKSGERTSSGLWKLTLFNLGISQVADMAITDEAYWADAEAKALRWVKAQPNSPAGHLAYVFILMQHGWMYRGSGWAEEVKKENWQPFMTYMNKARLYLLENKSIAAQSPVWYETMLNIATYQSWSEGDFKLLLNEALLKFPFFYQIYFAAIDYLTPKWHGNKEQIELFAQRAVAATAKKDKAGMYARVYWYASQANYGHKLFTDSAVRWTQMSTSIDDVLAQYPDEWNIQNFAYFACVAKDKAKTKALMDKIQSPPILEAWGKNGAFEYCQSWSSSP